MAGTILGVCVRKGAQSLAQSRLCWCHNKVAHAGGFRPQLFIVSQSWRLEDPNQGVGWGFLGPLPMAVDDCLLRVLVCVLMSVSRLPPFIRIRPRLLTSC